MRINCDIVARNILRVSKRGTLPINNSLKTAAEGEII